MKALVLSGGRGTRLRPITHTGAKQLVPVANKPILFYAIESVVAAGITDLGVIVGETAAEVRAAVGDGSRFGARVTYIEQPEPLGIAHAVKVARDWLAGDRFVMYLGDNLLLHGINDLVDDFERTDAAASVLLAHVREPQHFGVAEVVDGRISRLVEKPSQPPSDLALVGVYFLTPAIHTAIDGILPSARGELEITEALQRMIDAGEKVVPHVTSGWWKDTGRLEDILEANRILLEQISPRNEGTVGEDVRIEGRVVIEKGASLRHCVVRGPAIIGERSVLENAYVGPFTSIANDCTLREAEIQNSIVLAQCYIEGLNRAIDSSLIGRECRVTRRASRPRGVQLMLGDHSKVELA